MGPFIGCATLVIFLLIGFALRKNNVPTTTYDGNNIDNSEDKTSGAKKIKGNAKSAFNKAKELAEKRWKDGWVMFLLAFALAHVLAWYYFPYLYNLVFSQPIIWILQALLILRSMIRKELEKHKAISFFANASIAIVVLAAAFRYYGVWEKNTEPDRIAIHQHTPARYVERTLAAPNVIIVPAKDTTIAFVVGKKKSPIFLLPSTESYEVVLGMTNTSLWYYASFSGGPERLIRPGTSISTGNALSYQIRMATDTTTWEIHVCKRDRPYKGRCQNS